MPRTIPLLFMLLTAASTEAQSQPLQGPFIVIDGSTMRINGTVVRLADIAVPVIGERCIWHNKTLDCGVLARAGLMDITAGATVECKPAGNDRHRCFAGDFDLGFGMIHAGWAIALPGAPSHYQARMQQARDKKRALWSATDLDGSPEYALQLKR